MQDGQKHASSRLSPTLARVEHMYGGLGQDFIYALAAMVEQGTDPAIVAQAAIVLRDRLLLAERAQHGDDRIGMGGGVAGVSQDRGFDVVDVTADGQPTQAA